MPLPPPDCPRTPIHTRSVRIEGFRRADGALDLEAELLDVKPHDVTLHSGVRPGGEPIHLMRLRVTVDDGFDVLDAVAVFDAVPYRGECEAITPDYRRLVGLNLLRGFRAGVRERLGGVAGCTHLSELAQLLPTAAVQALAGDEQHHRRLADRDGGEPQRPMTIDRCHSWRSDGPVVERHFPMFYRPGRDAGSAEESRKKP
ncbi:MAG: DUF2889 domain-containing protein [Burkholderiaceae bacterium]|nr:DUF2889 domain-containing protein [Burkholderiaceae bacterium]